MTWGAMITDHQPNTLLLGLGVSPTHCKKCKGDPGDKDENWGSSKRRYSQFHDSMSSVPHHAWDGLLDRQVPKVLVAEV